MPARTLRLVMVLTAIIVIAGISLCLFDIDDTGDLCFSFFAATGSLAAITPVLPGGRVAPAFTPVACSYSSDRPTPPPRV